MKQQRDTLKRYQQRVEGLLEKERELAKKLLSENKREYVENHLFYTDATNLMYLFASTLEFIKRL